MLKRDEKLPEKRNLIVRTIIILCVSIGMGASGVILYFYNFYLAGGIIIGIGIVGFLIGLFNLPDLIVRRHQTSVNESVDDNNDIESLFGTQPREGEQSSGLQRQMGILRLELSEKSLSKTTEKTTVGGKTLRVTSGIRTLVFKADEELIIDKKTGEIRKCPICKLEFRSKQIICKCPECGEIFHYDHFMSWVERKETCPICKAKLKEVESVLLQ